MHFTELRKRTTMRRLSGRPSSTRRKLAGKPLCGRFSRPKQWLQSALRDPPVHVRAWAVRTQVLRPLCCCGSLFAPVAHSLVGTGPVTVGVGRLISWLLQLQHCPLRLCIDIWFRDRAAGAHCLLVLLSLDIATGSVSCLVWVCASLGAFAVCPYQQYPCHNEIDLRARRPGQGVV